MYESQVRPVFGLIRVCQNSVDPGKRTLDAQSLHFDLCEQCFRYVSLESCALAGESCQRLCEFGRAARGVMETAMRPPGSPFRHGPPMRHAMLPTEGLESLSCDQCGRGVAANDFEN